MAKKKWVISDTHFGHRNILKFKKPDGTPIRPGFYSEDGLFRNFLGPDHIQYHDEMLIQRWNDRVGPHDRVYFLGDFGHPLEIAGRLNGKKKLILGNHDDSHSASELDEYFEEVIFWQLFNEQEGFVHPVCFCHAPLHADERKPAVRRIQVHGHIHEKLITRPNGMVDPWYINVCVEHTNHAPVPFEDVVKEVEKRVKVIKSLGEL